MSVRNGPTLIVNADDFGRSHEVNEAILYCFRHALCSSTSILANGVAFEEACAIAREHRLLDHVGLHIVLDEGVPLTTDIRRCTRLCSSQGRFCARANRFFVQRDERTAIARELAAQINKARAAGLPITHMDSHHHIHELWPILPIVLNMAGTYNIPYVRLAVNCGDLTSASLRLYRRAVNLKIRSRGFARTRYFGSLANFLWHIEHIDRFPLASCEVMIHPVQDRPDRVVVDSASRAVPLSDRLPSELRAVIVSYAGRRYG